MTRQASRGSGHRRRGVACSSGSAQRIRAGRGTDPRPHGITSSHRDLCPARSQRSLVLEQPRLVVGRSGSSGSGGGSLPSPLDRTRRTRATGFGARRRPRALALVGSSSPRSKLAWCTRCRFFGTKSSSMGSLQSPVDEQIDAAFAVLDELVLAVADEGLDVDLLAEGDAVVVAVDDREGRPLLGIEDLAVNDLVRDQHLVLGADDPVGAVAGDQQDLVVLGDRELEAVALTSVPKKPVAGS